MAAAQSQEGGLIFQQQAHAHLPLQGNVIVTVGCRHVDPAGRPVLRRDPVMIIVNARRYGAIRMHQE